ncbi:hypothetical protein HMPREF1989_00292 [Porphyromonas gingivalis F0566]|nr:hypothetical protein HMPREF1989_00292 [Porphyromonas gingivalis F0566]
MLPTKEVRPSVAQGLFFTPFRLAEGKPPRPKEGRGYFRGAAG